MDIYKLWDTTVRSAVNNFARGENKESREDLRQDCFVQIMENLPTVKAVYEEKGDIQAAHYITRLCKHLVIKKLIGNDASELHELFVQDEPADVTFENKEMALNVDIAIKKLPRSEQFIVRGLYFQNKTQEDLAAELGWSHQKVGEKSKLCLAKLKVLLER